MHRATDVMRFLPFVAVFSLLPSATAATLESMTIERMARESTAIVRGVVGESRVERFGALVYTLSRFEPVEVIKGAPPQDLELALPGGEIGPLAQRFSGVPELQEGQEYLAFLWTGPSGRTQVVGFGQGLFEIHRAGERIEARRAPLDKAVVLEHGSEVDAAEQGYELDALLARITAALSENIGASGGARQ